MLRTAVSGSDQSFARVSLNRVPPWILRCPLLATPIVQETAYPAPAELRGGVEATLALDMGSFIARAAHMVQKAWNGGEKAIDDLEITVPRCKPETISALCKSTKFNKDEIKRIYQGFKQSCPSGIVNENTFKDMYCQFFPLADTTQYAHYVFKALDKDRAGTINFKEFVMGLSVLSRGSSREKLQWAFNLYDINKDGAVTKEEMFEIISSVYSLLGHYSAPMADERSAREHAARVFQKLDLNKDGVVTYDEFIETCLLDEDIVKSLSVLDTVLD